MKAGIITLTRNPNHGNILQNIAMSNAVKRLGIECDTIKNMKGSSLFPPNTLKRRVKIVVQSSARKDEKRRKSFVRYAEKYISYSRYVYSGGQWIYPEADYDFFITGSDQVWNPYFGFATEFEFLGFAPVEKRYSYAASVAVSSIPEQKKESIARFLQEMQRVSVREYSSIDLIESLTDGKVHPEVHIDPTMLMTAEEWEEYEEKPDSLQEGMEYIFVYLLGCETKEYRELFDFIAAGDRIIRMKETSDEDAYYWNPGNFLWIIHHAKCVVTDSFHATVFSILFERNFVVLPRKDKHADQADRLKTLLSKFDLIPHIYDGSFKSSFDNKDNVLEILLKERKKSMFYLESILNEVTDKKRKLE